MVKAAKKNWAPKNEPDRGIVIVVGWENNGGFYKLNPISEDLIREHYPDALINPGILLGYDKTEDYNRFHRPFWETLAQMISGLTAEQIAALGGVAIYDPDNEKVIWRWVPGSLKAG